MTRKAKIEQGKRKRNIDKRKKEKEEIFLDERKDKEEDFKSCS